MSHHNSPAPANARKSIAFGSRDSSPPTQPASPANGVEAPVEPSAAKKQRLSPGPDVSSSQNKTITEHMSVTRQVIKEASREAQRVFEGQMMRFAEQEALKLQLQLSSVSDIRRSNSDAAGLETEIVMLQTEKARLIQQLDGQKEEMTALRDKVWDSSNKVKTLEGGLNSLKEELAAEKANNRAMTYRLLAVKEVVVQYAGELHVHPDLLSRLKAQVIDVPSQPNTQQPLDDDDEDYLDALVQMEEGD